MTLPEQRLVIPVMGPGVEGMLVEDTLNVLAGVEPQELFAVTEIFPPVLDATVVIDVEVDKPVQPEGRVQV